MSFDDSRILVVGGAGFVGSNLVRRLLNEWNPSILVVDNLLSSERDNLPDDPRLEVELASINDAVGYIGADFEHVFHLSTFHGNQSSMADPMLDHEHNVLTTLSLCELLAGSDRLQSFVYSSAGCTVAEKTTGSPSATTEDAPISAYHDSPYQISKIVGEMYLNYYWSRYGLPAVKARFQNVYGPGEVLGAGEWRGTPATVWRNVVPTFVYRAIKGMPLLLHDSGTVSRDFIYVDDIVDGLLLCAQRGVAGEVYNLSSGEETTIRDLAETISAEVGGNVEIERIPGRAWDRSGRRFGDPTKSRESLGFEARTDLKTGVRETVSWTLDNLDRIDQAIEKHRARIESLAATAV